MAMPVNLGCSAIAVRIVSTDIPIQSMKSIVNKKEVYCVWYVIGFTGLYKFGNR